MHRPRSFSLLEELPGNSRVVTFRGPSRYARWMGAWWLLLSMIWIVGVVYTVGADAARRQSAPSYVLAGFFALPGVLVILLHVLLLWTRRTVRISPAEGTITETTRSPFRVQTTHYRLDWVRGVQLTYWVDGKYTWYVGIDVGSDHRIQLGSTPRRVDALHLSERVSQVLGVPLRDPFAEAQAVAQ